MEDKEKKEYYSCTNSKEKQQQQKLHQQNKHTPKYTNTLHTQQTDTHDCDLTN